jgi:multimeric flavodoxin WrbA
MKYIIAFQGSPRTGGNTATLLQEALDGAQSRGVATEMIHISKLHMTGCRGCYSCKKQGNGYGKCILKDDMTPIYKKIEKADAILMGSPVYMCAMTPEMKMVLDRMFPYIDMSLTSLLGKGKRCGLIFTQNQPDSELFAWHFNMTAFILKTIGFEQPEILVSVNTIGYKDTDLPNLVGNDLMHVHEDKLKHKESVMLQDMRKAFEMGARMAE